jgi:hypothetical protein
LSLDPALRPDGELVQRRLERQPLGSDLHLPQTTLFREPFVEGGNRHFVGPLEDLPSSVLTGEHLAFLFAFLEGVKAIAGDSL